MACGSVRKDQLGLHASYPILIGGRSAGA